MLHLLLDSAGYQAEKNLYYTYLSSFIIKTKPIYLHPYGENLKTKKGIWQRV